MLELICMSLLGIAYAHASIDEAKKEKKLKERAQLQDKKISMFCYAVRHNLKYDEVVKLIEKNELSFEDIRKDSEEYEKGLANG